MPSARTLRLDGQRTQHPLQWAKRLDAWHDAMARAATAVPTSEDDPVDDATLLELRAIRERLTLIRHAHDQAALAAMAAAPTHPRHAWATAALAQGATTIRRGERQQPEQGRGVVVDSAQGQHVINIQGTLTLTQAEEWLRQGRMSCRDFVAFLASWCEGKLEHRWRNGWMEVCHTSPRGQETWTRYQPPAPAIPGTVYDWPPLAEGPPT